MQMSEISAHATAENQELNKAFDAFQNYLLCQNMSSNTITAYMYGVKHFYYCYDQLSPDNISLYKVSLMDHYQPQTVNIRIRALNCFLKFLGIWDYKIHAIRIQQKCYLDRVISQADYEYLKRRLWEDGQYTFYFIIRFIAATGVRVSELVMFEVDDVYQGYRDIYSKGNKLRRIYIPSSLQRNAMDWLETEGRHSGPPFLSHLGCCISISGIRAQLKTYACRYNLDSRVVYPHSFRHRFAKNFIENGGDIAFLSNLLGHDSIESTRIYLRRTSTEQAQIFNQVVNW